MYNLTTVIILFGFPLHDMEYREIHVSNIFSFSLISWSLSFMTKVLNNIFGGANKLTKCI